jgi:hypothetical protein
MKVKVFYVSRTILQFRIDSCSDGVFSCFGCQSQSTSEDIIRSLDLTVFPNCLHNKLETQSLKPEPDVLNP